MYPTPQGNKNTLLHSCSHHLNYSPQTTDSREEFQVHVPFDTILEMKPYLVPGPTSTLRMELIGIVTHQGTKEQGHYVAITKKGNEWFSYSDAIVTKSL